MNFVNSSSAKTDVILIGGGIMSATLGVLLKELKPDLNIKMFEQLGEPALESSNAWNNAGTGHSALCELNYTTESADGNIDVSKALDINEQFQLSKQFWTHLVKTGKLKNPENFIKTVPHMSFVEGADNIDFLKRRLAALQDNPLFRGMEISEDHAVLKEWVPLMMEGRDPSDKIAITKMDSGTDINFGRLTVDLFNLLAEQGVELNYNHAVKDLKRDGRGWKVKVHNAGSGKTEEHTARFVFIGAGGYSLPLLQKTNIPESKHVGGFPVSGLFLVCNNEEVINKHLAKVYGKAKVGAPPMSVPHLDTRYIDGKRSLLFGPYAGFSPKFLKEGSYFDLIGSVKPNNVLTMLSAGAKEMKLTQYLISQVIQSHEDRMAELREFVPEAKSEDWEIVVAGQRVQVIKDTDKGKGTLQFGTEVISAEDGSIAALLGASPGASTAVHVMLNVLDKCFKDYMAEWQPKIQEMVPSYGQQLGDNEELFSKVNEETSAVLNLVKKKETVSQEV
ncbi:malate:quinone oxidoreductase [Macrococcus equipercicus]|uniref:Probable malate:quinone oxidoreductase n=1 Tax=Macrococcus equipercicus TaxID=69967 RepID=A0ABQ6RAV0_9STAP|nr:malate:quinone oxidoreductase [Macrococcus equipercicus]KAA1042340.1 malate:quinone oxidoreductase [Macrococcus equipercicus]